eukprot:11070328-Heterocapsa_arctica.AAC.1
MKPLTINATGKLTSPPTTSIGEETMRLREALTLLLLMCQDRYMTLHGFLKTRRTILFSYKNTGGCQVRLKPGNQQPFEK